MDFIFYGKPVERKIGVTGDDLEDLVSSLAAAFENKADVTWFKVIINNYDLNMKIWEMLRHRTPHAPFVFFQVLIKPKPVFQTAVVSEQTRQLVTETLQQVTRSADVGPGQTSGQDGSTKDVSGSLASEASHSSAQGTLPFSSCRRDDIELFCVFSYINMKNNPMLFVKLLKN